MSIQAKQVTYRYRSGEAGELPAVDHVTFDLKKGELVGIIGRTGSGKSTLLQLLNGLLRPESGEIRMDGEEITSRAYKRSKISSRVGLVFQYPEYQLFEETVWKDVAFGPANMGLGEEEVGMRTEQALHTVGLDPETAKTRSPFLLSGGQKRCAAIAGVLAMDPEILILDEPAAGLDPHMRRVIFRLLRTLREQGDRTILVVSHNMEEIAALADRILVMDHGHLVMDGTPEEVFSDRQKLRSLGLDIPPCTAIAEKLAKRLGIEIGTPLTAEAVAAALTEGGGRDD